MIVFYIWYKSQRAEDTEVKADPKVYPVNEEAKIGRAAITVTNFDLSGWEDYDVPQDGYKEMIFVIAKRVYIERLFNDLSVAVGKVEIKKGFDSKGGTSGNMALIMTVDSASAKTLKRMAEEYNLGISDYIKGIIIICRIWMYM